MALPKAVRTSLSLDGIVPGVTTLTTASYVLTNIGYVKDNDDQVHQYMNYVSEYFVPNRVSIFPLCEGMNSKCKFDKVQTLYAFGMNQLMLGDALIKFGKPQYIDLSVTQGLLIHFDGAIVATTGWDSPNYSLTFIKLEHNPTSAIKLDEWHGFVPLWKYCKYETKHYFCFRP